MAKDVKNLLTGGDHLSKMNINRPAGYPSEKNIPAVLVLKRKAIRVYPDNQKVVLYYSQALDKYVSIPFGPQSDVLGSPLNESRKPKRMDDDGEKTYKILAKKYPHLAAMYKQAKEEQPERRALRRIVGKRSRAEIMALPKNERDVAYGIAKEKIAAADMSYAKKLGLQHRYALSKLTADIKDKIKGTPKPVVKKEPDPTEAMKNIKPKTVSESFRNRVSVIREERLDEAPYEKTDAALDAASFIPGPVGSAASLGSAYRSAKRGDYVGAALDVAGALPGVGYLAKGAKVAKTAKQAGALEKAKSALQSYKARRQAAKNMPDWAKKMKKGAPAKGGRRGKGGILGKIAGGVGAAGAAIGAGLEALSGAAGAASSAAGAAERAGERYGGRKEYSFELQPKIGDPRQGQVTQGAEITRQQRRMLGVQESFASNIDIIKYIAENDISSHPIQIGEGEINLNNRVAKKVLKIYESLNRENKKKIESMLNESATSFRKVINFAVRQ